MSIFSNNTKFSKTDDCNNKSYDYTTYSAEKQYYDYLKELKKQTCEDECNFSTAFMIL